MSFLVLPPEINSLRIFSGVGSGPMRAVAAAWDGLAAKLGSAAESFSSVTSGLTGSSQAWQGAASAAMAAPAAPYAGFWVRRRPGRRGRRRRRGRRPVCLSRRWRPRCIP